jgi:hypothetical protein
MLRPELQTHFRNRLVRYNPTVILNCCTDGVPLAHAFVRQPGEPTELPAGPFQAASPKQIVSRLVDHKLAPRLFNRHYYTKKEGHIEFHSRTPAVQFDNAVGHVVNLSHPSRAWRA